jgi:hypothetical protein
VKKNHSDYDLLPGDIITLLIVFAVDLLLRYL